MNITMDYKIKLMDAIQVLRNEDIELFVKYSERLELELLRLEKAEKLEGGAKQLQIKLCESRFRRLWNDLRSELSEVDGI